MLDFTPIVGMRVGIVGRHDYQDGFATVAKVTPAGQIVTDDGTRFNKNGREVGVEEYRGKCICSAEQMEKRKAAKKEQKERNARHTFLSNHVAAVLGRHKNGFGDYLSSPTAEEKAELIALINAL